MKAQFVKAAGWKRPGHKRLSISQRDDRYATSLRGAVGHVAARHQNMAVIGWEAVCGNAHVKLCDTKREAIDYLRAWRIMHGLNEHGMTRNA